MRMNNSRNGFLVLMLSALLAACGGGGSGGGSGGTVTPASSGEHVGPKGDGTALVTWEAPTSKADGSCLSDLKSFRVSYGLSPGVYDSQQTVDAGSLSSVPTGKSDGCGEIRSFSYMIDKLGTASWYFAVQAIDEAGNVSEYSNEAVKTIQ